MITIMRNEYESGDKVRLDVDNLNPRKKEWYHKNKPKLLTEVITVVYQDGDDVFTDMGWFDCAELILAEMEVQP